MTDPYEVLGLSRLASLDEVRDAYRRLSVKFHPDKHADNELRDLAEEKFRRIKDAYEAILREREGGTGSTSSGQTHSEEAAERARIEHLAQTRQWHPALEALAHFERRFGRSADSLSLRAQILAELNRHLEAVQYLSEAIQLSREDGNLWYMHGTFLSVLGKDREALASFRRARTYLGSIPDVLACMGVCHERMGEGEEARKLFSQVRQMDPNNEILAARDQTWLVGNKHVPTAVAQQEATANACCLCALLECVFDCI